MVKNVNFQAVALPVPFQLVGFVNVCGARLFCPKCSCKGNVVASNLSLFLYPPLLPENLSLQTAVPVYFDYHFSLRKAFLMVWESSGSSADSAVIKPWRYLCCPQSSVASPHHGAVLSTLYFGLGTRQEVMPCGLLQRRWARMLSGSHTLVTSTRRVHPCPAPLVAAVHGPLFPSKSCSVQARDRTPSLGSFVPGSGAARQQGYRPELGDIMS